MPAPETLQSIIQELAVYVVHDDDCPGRDGSQNCICGLYGTLRRAANICQVLEAEIAYENARQAIAEFGETAVKLEGELAAGDQKLRVIAGGKAQT